ncbi:hypothetical protein [Treponema vincentii]|uniref:hypothetical protein n=1 Tax=Treponema vincentii TaxID=69710 RepID=UPI003D92D7C9
MLHSISKSRVALYIGIRMIKDIFLQKLQQESNTFEKAISTNEKKYLYDLSLEIDRPYTNLKEYQNYKNVI